MASSETQTAPPVASNQGRQVDLSKLDQILEKFKKPAPSEVIPLLQAVQGAYGYLPTEALEALSQRTGIPLTQIYGVATFYAQFSLVPRGRHVVRICRGTACDMRGGAKVRAAVKQRLGIGVGETTKDMKFTLETVACLGACALSPVMVVGSTYYGKMTSKKAIMVLADCAKD